MPEIKLAARALNLELQEFGVQGPAEFANAFSEMAERRIGALLILDENMLIVNAKALADLAVRQRLPGSGFPEFAVAGGLMAYGVDFPDMWRRAATYVDKLLKGAEPGDLPIERPTRFQLIINLGTAKTLGLEIPETLLATADEVIQ